MQIDKIWKIRQGYILWMARRLASWWWTITSHPLQHRIDSAKYTYVHFHRMFNPIEFVRPGATVERASRAGFGLAFLPVRVCCTTTLVPVLVLHRRSTQSDSTHPSANDGGDYRYRYSQQWLYHCTDLCDIDLPYVALKTSQNTYPDPTYVRKVFVVIWIPHRYNNSVPVVPSHAT